MKLTKYKAVFILIVGSLILSACSSVAATSWPGVSVSPDNKYVYAAYANGVFKVDASNGNMVWRYPDPADNAKQFFAAPAVTDALVVASDYEKVLLGLDPVSKAEKWTFANSNDKYIANPLIVGSTVLAPSADSNLYALTLDGKMLWQFPTTSPIWGAPVSDGKLVYVTSMDHFLYAVNLSDGKQSWKMDLGAAAVYGPNLASDGNIYVSTLAKEVLAINVTEKNIVWRFPTNGSPWAVPVFKDGVVYLGDLSGKVYAISSSDGKALWQVDAPGPVISSPAITSNGLVFTAETGDVFELSFSGQKDWNQKFNGKLYSTPAIAGDLLVVGVTAGDKNLLLVGYDSSGLQKWTFSVP